MSFNVIFIFLAWANDLLSGDPAIYSVATLAGIFGLIALVSFFVGLIALALNVPLLLKTYREGSRLEKLGLSSLSTSLWKESRRSRWISRVRSILLLCIGISLVVGAVLASKGMINASSSTDRFDFFLGVLIYAITAGLLFGARYLRNQRERMDMAASAEQLRKALQSLQQREGSEFVSVPAELLERTATIESAQIKKERKEAVLESAASQSSAYAIEFERGAAEQRASLPGLDRLELEDLVADLSTEGALRGAQPSTTSSAEAPKIQCTTESRQVEIEYVVDHEARRIRVVTVKGGGTPSPATAIGAGNG